MFENHFVPNSAVQCLVDINQLPTRRQDPVGLDNNGKLVGYQVRGCGENSAILPNAVDDRKEREAFKSCEKKLSDYLIKNVGSKITDLTKERLQNQLKDRLIDWYTWGHEASTEVIEIILENICIATEKDRQFCLNILDEMRWENFMLNAPVILQNRPGSHNVIAQLCELKCEDPCGIALKLIKMANDKQYGARAVLNYLDYHLRIGPKKSRVSILSEIIGRKNADSIVEGLNNEISHENQQIMARYDHIENVRVEEIQKKRAAREELIRNFQPRNIDDIDAHTLAFGVEITSESAEQFDRDHTIFFDYQLADVNGDFMKTVDNLLGNERNHGRFRQICLHHIYSYSSREQARDFFIKLFRLLADGGLLLCAIGGYGADPSINNDQKFTDGVLVPAGFEKANVKSLIPMTLSIIKKLDEANCAAIWERHKNEPIHFYWEGSGVELIARKVVNEKKKMSKADRVGLAETTDDQANSRLASSGEGENIGSSFRPRKSLAEIKSPLSLAIGVSMDPENRDLFDKDHTVYLSERNADLSGDIQVSLNGLRSGYLGAFKLIAIPFSSLLTVAYSKPPKSLHPLFRDVFNLLASDGLLLVSLKNIDQSLQDNMMKSLQRSGFSTESIKIISLGGVAYHHDALMDAWHISVPAANTPGNPHGLLVKK